MNDPSEVTWSAMRRYELRRWLASRQAGVKAWPSSKVGGWRLGCGPVGAFLPPCRDRSGRPLARGIDGDLVGVLAAMALAVVG